MEVTWGHSGNEYIIVYPAFKRLYYGTSGPIYDSNFPIMVLFTANTTLLILIIKGKAILYRREQVLRVSGGWGS